MTSLGLDVFQCLCDAANQIERLRQDCAEGSTGWCACTEILAVLDGEIDRLVASPALDDDEEKGDDDYAA